MNIDERLYAWSETKQGAAIAAVVCLVTGTFVALRAIDSGSLLQYLITILLLAGAVQNIATLVRLQFGSRASKSSKGTKQNG